MSLSIKNVVRVSVVSALRGLPNVNTSMLGFITDEVPIPADYGTFRAYKDAIGPANDFGSNSETARLAQKVFSQQQNILNGSGSLLIIPRVQSAPASRATIQGRFIVDFSQLTATDYNINLNVDGAGAGDLAIGEIDRTSIATIQASLNSTAVDTAGAEFIVSGEISKATVQLRSKTTGSTSSVIVGVSATGTDIAPLLGVDGETATGADAGLERIKDAILRTVSSIPYFGLVYNEKMTDADLTETASLVQSLSIVQIVGSNLAADITGIFTTLKDSGYTKTRMLYYSNSESEALDLCAGYASLYLSVNTSGSRTALTMHLKEITGVLPDPIYSETVGQTRYDECKEAGVDTYGDYKVPGMTSFKANEYADLVFFKLAVGLDLQIAGFNFLKQNPTKTPQTEDGMAGMETSFRKVCEKYVTNGYVAPGAWNSSVYFGKPQDHIRNIAEFGYWLYSLPINQQSQADREDRIAPLSQIAFKTSGAIHSADISVFVEE